MFQDFSSHISKFFSTTKLVQSRPNLSLVPHRLDDNLHWRCSSCNTFVATHETHLHLNSCLEQIEILDPILSPLSDQEFDKKLLCIQIKPMERHQRPRTKTLERPTPNLKHPVINESKFKESKQNSKGKHFLKITSDKTSIPNGALNNSQTTSLRKVIDKTTEEMKDSSLIGKSSSQCKTCIRDITPEKFHNVFTTNKSSILRRSKNEEKCSSSPIASNKTNCMIGNKNFQIKANYSSEQYKTKNETKLSNQKSRCNACKDSYEDLSAHEQQCLKAKKCELNKKDSNDRKNASPIINDGCDPAGWEHFKSQLVPCSSCFRTFFPHRLPVHEKSCRGIAIKQTKSTQESKVYMKANIPIKSGFLDCSNCGRKYSSTSLTLHELKCRNNNNARKYSTDTNELNIAWEHFKTQLVPCNKCKRKFLPDRLEKHEPNCKASPITGTNH